MGKIAEVIGIPKPSVQNIIKRIRNRHTPLPACQSGAPKKLNEQDIRHLVSIVRKEPFASYDRINAQLTVKIHHNTLVNYLKEVGFKSYFAAHKPELTEENRKRRLHWAKERVNWTNEQWEGVVWSDESRFTVEGYDGGARVLKKVPAPTYCTNAKVGAKEA